MAKQFIQSLKPLFDIPQAPLPQQDKPIPRNPEIEAMAGSLLEQFGPAVMHAATAVHFVSTFITIYSQNNGADLSSISRTICAALRLWVASEGESGDDVPKAVACIRRAGEVAAYLHSLPD